jgi:hypothetical protein
MASNWGYFFYSTIGGKLGTVPLAAGGGAGGAAPFLAFFGSTTTTGATGSGGFSGI